MPSLSAHKEFIVYFREEEIVPRTHFVIVLYYLDKLMDMYKTERTRGTVAERLVGTKGLDCATKKSM